MLMDNPSAHKMQKVRELVEEAGCELLYLLPYSPDIVQQGGRARFLRTLRLRHTGSTVTIPAVIAHKIKLLIANS